MTYETFTDMTDRQKMALNEKEAIHIRRWQKKNPQQTQAHTHTHTHLLYQIQYINLKCGRTCLFAVMKLINFHKNCIIIIVVGCCVRLGAYIDFVV